VICSDKTGTLTENAMTVTELWAGGEAFIVDGQGYQPEGRVQRGETAVAPAPTSHEALLAGAPVQRRGALPRTRTMANHRRSDRGRAAGRGAQRGLDETTLRSVFPRRDELPFDSARQTMATLHEVEGQPVAYVKGAIEKLLPACRAMLAADGSETPLEPAALEAVAALMAARGLRVLALARRRLDADLPLGEAAIGRDLVFIGLAGMIDPPRARAIGAVRTCHAAGIVVKMITGDHAVTARSIAAQIGIVADGHAAEVLTGRDLARLDDAALQAAACRVNVFARVEPEQKLRLVRALQAQGEVVAMTGDGVNDAPALKQADIGIAMGLGGTDVAKEAAAMVLTDDNFATIEAAVEEGRGIYDNLVKFITWTLPTNIGEGLVILAAIVAGATLPITPLQILWINMTTAVLLGLPLAFEPAERGIMRRPPRPPGARVLDGGTDRAHRTGRRADAGGILRHVPAGTRPRPDHGRGAHHRHERLRRDRDRLSLQLPLAAPAGDGHQPVFQPLGLGRSRPATGAADGDHLLGADEPGVLHGTDPAASLGRNHRHRAGRHAGHRV
jgi:cation-transporting ATPase F